MPGQCQQGSGHSPERPQKRVQGTEEREVGPTSALIRECFENCFMPVASTDFDSMGGRRS